MSEQETLSEQQVEQFKRDGYLVARRWYSAEEIAALAAWIDELAARTPEGGKQMVYLEDSRTEPGKRILSRIERFRDYHEQIGELIDDTRLTGAVGQLLGDRAVLFKEKINFKLPGGGGFEPHQDIQPGWDEYASYFISVLVTVDRSTPANGCLELAAGHHTRGMFGEKWKPLVGSQLDGIHFEKIPMDPGDVAFFDCFTPHQSGDNTTGQPRRNLYVTFNRAAEGDHRERYFSDKRKSYPPDDERDPGANYEFRV